MKEAEALTVIQRNPDITPRDLAQVTGLPLATAKRHIFFVRRIERMTGVPIAGWRIARSGTCVQCGTEFAEGARGARRKFCDACQRDRLLMAKRKYNAKTRKQPGLVVIGDIPYRRERVEQARSFFEKNPNATVREFAAAMEMGEFAARYAFGAMKRYCHTRR